MPDRPADAASRAQAIVEALGGRWTGQSGACRCPAHADNRPSLFAQQTGGSVVRIGDDVAAAAAAIAQSPLAVTSVRDATGKRIAIRALPAATGTWLLVGPMPASGPIKVRLSDGTARNYLAPAHESRSDSARRTPNVITDHRHHQAHHKRGVCHHRDV